MYEFDKLFHEHINSFCSASVGSCTFRLQFLLMNVQLYIEVGALCMSLGEKGEHLLISIRSD